MSRRKKNPKSKRPGDDYDPSPASKFIQLDGKRVPNFDPKLTRKERKRLRDLKKKYGREPADEKQGLLRRVLNWFLGLFGRKKVDNQWEIHEKTPDGPSISRRILKKLDKE